jgi:hypothetical protein
VDKKVSAELKKRKMLALKQFKTYAVTQGPNFSIERKKVHKDPTTLPILRNVIETLATFKIRLNLIQNPNAID